MVLLCAACTKSSKEDKFNFVIYAREGELTSNELLLTDVNQLIIAIPYKVFIEKWSQSFQEKQPNAVINFYDKEGHYQAIAVVLMSATLKSDGVHFGIKKIGEGAIERDGHLGETALFVDGFCFSMYCDGPGGLE